MSPQPAPKPVPPALPPDIPPIPSLTNLKVFLWGALWAGVAGAAPAGMMLIDWLKDWDNPVNWGEISHVAAAGAIVGLGAYWRKHKALLTTPPNQP